MNKKVELVHPWKEWIELMERLVQQNYFDHKRKDEDKLVEDLGFDMSEVVEEGFDFTRDWKTVQTACLNFGKDRFDIFRSLSRHDIQVLVGHGCPSADKKVVFSAKLLRKHVHLDEGDVCSSCNLRSSCERAYLVTNKEDEARTIDIMRILLTYGFDPVNGSVVNESLLKIKSVKTVVRKLLHEVVKLSAVPIDPNLPPPIIKKPPPKVKIPPPPPRKRVGRDDIEMKKGDWLCPKCDFMNFAKNTVCLQCDANRPKRQLLPGEWECPGCNFLNYRRNMVCFHCEHNRPPDEFTENQAQDRQRGRTRMEKVPSRAEVSNAWNFDFDDNESDGADVAAFEYADSRKLDEDSSLDRRGDERENTRRGAEDGFYSNRGPPREAHEREYSDIGPKQPPGTGFDDFADEDDDDVESYELDTQNNDQIQKPNSIDFSELEVNSESEDSEGNSIDRRTSFARNSSSRSSKPMVRPRKGSHSGDDDDELDFDSDDLPVHRNWKSSHVANSRQKSRGRGSVSFGSDEEPSGTEDDEDDFQSRRGRNSRTNFGKRGRRDLDDEPFSGSESDDEYRRSRGGGRSRGGTKAGPDRRNTFKRGLDDNDDRKDYKFNRSSSSRGSHGSNERGSRGGGYGNGGHSRTNGRDRESDFRNSRGSGRRESGSSRGSGRRFNNFDNRSATDSSSYFDDDRHRRPRENVR